MFTIENRYFVTGRESGVGWLQNTMFQGGQLLPFRNEDPRVLSRRPLRIWKNTFRATDVFIPEATSAVVVSERVLNELRRVANIPYVRVSVDLAFQWSWDEHTSANELSDWPDEYVEKVENYLPRLGTRVETADRYFELIPGREDASSPELKGDLLSSFRYDCGIHQLRIADDLASILGRHIDHRYLYLGPEIEDIFAD
jgi:hypothetical protein